jgi:cobyrinic acid a,c-diamide synthase
VSTLRSAPRSTEEIAGPVPGDLHISTPRIVIAGTNSGVGKTTFVSGLCGALRHRGLRVSVFKCGPDYLDPTYHFRAAGVHSQTLDGWMMGNESVLSTFQSAAKDSDIAVIEGVMGLFDGVEATSDIGSTAEIAKWLGAPVLLVINAAGMSRSVAAMASGFATFDPELNVAGIICNRAGSRRHLEMLEAASTKVPVLGGLPKDPEHSFPERHLGLRTADESFLPGSTFDAWANHVAEWCDINRILGIAREAPNVSVTAPRITPAQPRSCRIGIAVDEAFHFYYDENLRLLQTAGAVLIEFSPISTPHLPELDGLYLGGGYPEVHARELANNESLRREILVFCHAGKPVYAECGGLMYLCEGIRTRDGSRYPMAAWFEGDAVMNGRLEALGYVEVNSQRDTILGPSGQTFRGHQFRYSTLVWKSEPERVYRVRGRRDKQITVEGYCKGRVLGSYVHAHWASNPSIAESFVNACRGD